LEDRTFNEVLGKPLISSQAAFENPVVKFIFDKWGTKITKPIFQPILTSTMEQRIKAGTLLGFDSVWAIYEETFIILDSHTMARDTGSIFNLQPDGHGNMTYMYKCPGITSREDFEAWPHWPKIDDLAHNTYKFYNKMMKKYGDKTCLLGQGPVYGIQEVILWAVGFERMALWISREKDLVKRFIDMSEELCLKTAMAMMDAGVQVIFQTDDFAFKTGPFMSPRIIDKTFGPSYKRVIKAVHDRGGKYILHSCGDNTLMFDTFISWGVDGLHAYENTSNVDIFKEKQIHGDKVTIIGGVGVDYLLTERSTDEEVRLAVKDLIAKLGPGGRFMIGPVHGHSSMPAHKLEVMLDAVRTYGNYPIAA
jgi:uroporphyrinogen decarboxylase